MQKIAIHLWESNLLGNRIIELPMAYLLAEGVKMTCNSEADQAILDAFDPITEQAAIEAEEKAKAEHAAFLSTLTPKTISDLQSKLATAESELADAKARLAKLETAAETAEKA
jgi:hypothetical protein